MRESKLFMTFDKVSEKGIISGYITRYGEVDSYGSATQKGCFAKTIEAFNQGRVIPVLWQHDRREPIGKFITMKDDDIGCYVVIQLDLNVTKAKEAYSLILNKIVSGLSIGGYIVEASWNTETEVETLIEIDLIETSVVTFPACDNARIDECREVEHDSIVRRIESALKATGALSNKECKKYASQIAAEKQKQNKNEDERQVQTVDNTIDSVEKQVLNSLKNFSL